VPVTQAGYGGATTHIQVLLAVGVVEIHALPPNSGRIGGSGVSIENG
jgi:hypothetical protein